MPRIVEEILAHPDELAPRFESYNPSEHDEINLDAVNELRQAIAEQTAAERHLIETIRYAREAHMSWNAIGTIVGTSGKAGRQRYTQLAA